MRKQTDSELMQQALDEILEDEPRPQMRCPTAREKRISKTRRKLARKSRRKNRKK